MTVQAIPITSIRVDGGTQIRTSTYPETIAEYSEAMIGGAVFPPLIAFFDGADYWLADGFHRLGAWKAVGDALGKPCIEVPCDVREGGRREAIIYACGANDSHGIPRKPDDKRAAVDTMLKNPLVALDEDGVPWASAKLARICKVSHTFVDKRKAVTLPKVADCNVANSVSYEKDGKTVTRVTGSAKRPMDNAAFWQADQARKSLKEGPPPPFKQSTEWDHIYTLLRQVDEAIGQLPAPNIAAENLPISLAHGLPIDRVVQIQRWWQEFTRFWAARDPEIQRHRQEVRDFIRESKNVAAE